MKAIVIENEWDLDTSITAFLHDFPDLFESVDIHKNCLNRSTSGMMVHVAEADTIIIATTFMYKDQVEEYIDALLQSPKKYNIFVHWACRPFNDWKTGWSSDRELRNKVIKLIKAGHTIYDFYEDMDLDASIHSQLGAFQQERAPYTYKKLIYDDEIDLFYQEGYNSLYNIYYVQRDEIEKKHIDKKISKKECDKLISEIDEKESNDLRGIGTV